MPSRYCPMSCSGRRRAVSFPPSPRRPVSTNASMAATWPVNTTLDVILNDIDMDGFVDVLVRE